jgi:hypothetical protein
MIDNNNRCPIIMTIEMPSSCPRPFTMHKTKGNIPATRKRKLMEFKAT